MENSSQKVEADPVHFSVSCFSCGKEGNLSSSRVPTSNWDFCQIGVTLGWKWVIDESSIRSVFICDEQCLDAALTPTGRLRKKAKKVIKSVEASSDESSNGDNNELTSDGNTSS